MKIRGLLFFVFLLITVFAWGGPVKVACVGNSVTYGFKVENREQNCYPAQLGVLLGSGYEVRNFGKSGATLLNHGHRPYMGQQEFKDAVAFAADRVVIHLGFNDTDPCNWPNYRDEFVADYLHLCAGSAPCEVDVYICIRYSRWKRCCRRVGL